MHHKSKSSLLDFAFLELNMFAHNWIVLGERQFFCLGARVLFCGVEEASIGGADQLDFDSSWLRHAYFLNKSNSGLRNAPANRCAAMVELPAKVKRVTTAIGHGYRRIYRTP
jgi:hypothetical protein